MPNDAGTSANTTLERIFRNGRTHYHWQRQSLSVDLLRQAWDLARTGPTSANCSPVRIVFVMSAAAKTRLRPCLIPGNVEKTMTAPATAIIGHDLAFYERLPELFPHTDAKSWFVGNERLIETTAMRNGTLQGAYFMLPPGLWASTAGRCPGSTTRWSTPRSLPGRRSGRTSSATLATAMPACCIPAARASPSSGNASVSRPMLRSARARVSSTW